ncbi:MAG: serine/threonine protein kinase [Gammaproteobacteria bacterium]|nr:serine/threonine protein kinase [Gammaproteobacteria bacterium]
MKFFSTMKAERCLTQLLAERDAHSSAARKALDSLQGIGRPAIPGVIDAFATADEEHSGGLVTLLAWLLDDTTFPLYADGLGHSNKLCVAGVTKALALSGSYDTNKLIELLGTDKVSKPALIELLGFVRKSLNAKELLKQAYELEPRDKSAVFKIIGDIAGPELVPDLIARVEGKNPSVRLNIIELLSRFNQPEVARALERRLKDRNKLVRKAALEALAAMPGERDIGLICSLLADPELEVQALAVDLVVKIRHPDTMKHLVTVLKDESEFARRSAVEVLNEIAEPGTIKYLLMALEDGDWWVRSRASDALAKIGGPKVMDAVLQLVGDKSDNIRRSAIEILNQTKDERAVNHLITATRDNDWWVRERAADALAEIRSEQAAPALLEMLSGDPRSVPAALRALGRLGSPAVLPQLLPLLDRPEKDIRIEAVNAIGLLATSDSADTLKNRLRSMATGSDETMAKVAAQALSKIESISAASTIAPEARTDTLGAGAKTLLVDNARGDEMVKGLDRAIKLDVSTLKKGDLIEGRYRYIEKIGKGAFGTVVLVADEVVGEQLILKFLNPTFSSDEEMMERFVHELRYSRKITHRNVIRIFDFVSLGGNYAISMEYFPSHTLGAEMTKNKPLPFAKTNSWARDMANGMAVAHQVGIVHRDLKPANILINEEGLLKIVDFGVAAAASSSDTQLTKTGYVIGSPRYMAPEQILGKKVDHRADIYSIGVIVYEMLTGTPPYTKGDYMSVMYQHVQGKAKLCEELNPDIPLALAAVVRKAMEVDKLKRFNSMDELREALERAA